jgi:hypothetical protein
MKKIVFIILSLMVFNYGFSQSLVDYTQLKQILPEEVLGYKLDGKKEGSTMKMDGVSMSNASATYIKDNNTIDIVIMDYLDSDEMFFNSAAMVKAGVSYESDDGFAKTIRLDNKLGYLAGDKGSSSTTLILIWSERYVLNITINGVVDETIVKTIYSKLDLSMLN